MKISKNTIHSICITTTFMFLVSLIFLLLGVSGFIFPSKTELICTDTEGKVAYREEILEVIKTKDNILIYKNTDGNTEYLNISGYKKCSEKPI